MRSLALAALAAVACDGDTSPSAPTSPSTSTSTSTNTSSSPSAPPSPGPSTPAPAPTDAAPTPRPLAGFTVIDLISTVRDGETVRAIVSVEEIYPLVTLERIRFGDTEGDPATLVWQRHVELAGLAIEGGERLEALRWDGDDLAFEVRREAARWRCRVARATTDGARATCTRR